MSETESGRNQDRSWGSVIAFLMIGLPLLLFLPLILAAVEHTIWKTHRVEDLCRDVGIHGFLGGIYEPIISLLRTFF
ncbi:MAG: hypothetical protein HUJ26_12430 [Planctomycetaceae bacterium]|nr:hypothetical protein [Planctomycetaceae bacterium]